MGIRLKVFGATDVGKVRTNNEDSFLVADLARDEPNSFSAAIEFDVKDRGILMAVSDGMGGEAAGEVASALVVEALRQSLADHKDTSESRKMLIEKAVVKANAEVFRAASAPDKQGMGATLTAVFVEGGDAYIAEVGDSRAYLVRAGRIRQMTRDQSFVQLLLESGVISEDEAASYPHRNVILQAMGQKPEVTVAIGRLSLRRGDVLLLCSDGLSGKVSADEMRAVIEKEPDFEGAAKRLIEMANERGGDDNVTVVLAGAFGEGLPSPMRAETVTQTFEVLQEYAPPPSRSASQAEKKMVTDAAAKEPAKDTEEKDTEEKDTEEKKKTEPEPSKEPLAEKPVDSNADEDASSDEESSSESDEDSGSEDESPDAAIAKKAPPPTQEQRVREMVTLAVVFLGVGLLLYYVFR